jgi:hypothetical protein
MTCVGPEYRDRSPFASNAWWHAQATGAVSPFTRAVPAVDRDHHTALNASQTDAALDPGSSRRAGEHDAKLIGVNARPGSCLRPQDL